MDQSNERLTALGALASGYAALSELADRLRREQAEELEKERKASAELAVYTPPDCVHRVGCIYEGGCADALCFDNDKYLGLITDQASAQAMAFSLGERKVRTRSAAIALLELLESELADE